MLIYLGFLSEFIKAVSSQGPFYKNNAIDSMFKLNSASPLSHNSRNHSAVPKVVFVVLDGMRYDAASISSEFNAFRTDENFARDSLFMKTESAIPSMSVPNWFVEKLSMNKGGAFGSIFLLCFLRIGSR